MTHKRGQRLPSPDGLELKGESGKDCAIIRSNKDKLGNLRLSSYANFWNIIFFMKVK